MAFGFVLESFLVLVCKTLWNQPRPELVIPGIHAIFRLKFNSFPSGHAAMACVFAGIMMYREKTWLRVFWVLFVVLISYQRIYVGVHFPLDVLVGLAIGFLSTYIILAFWKKRLDAKINEIEKLRA